MKDDKPIPGYYRRTLTPSKQMCNLKTRAGLDTAYNALFKRGAIGNTHRVLFLVDVAMDKKGRFKHLSMSCGGITRADLPGHHEARGGQAMSRSKIQMTPAGLRPCGACVHGGYNAGRKHCHLCQTMGLYTPTPEEEAERVRRAKASAKARESALKKGGRK